MRVTVIRPGDRIRWRRAPAHDWIHGTYCRRTETSHIVYCNPVTLDVPLEAEIEPVQADMAAGLVQRLPDMRQAVVCVSEVRDTRERTHPARIPLAELRKKREAMALEVLSGPWAGRSERK